MTKTNAPTSLGELSRLLASRRLHLEAADLRSVSPYHQCLHRRWRTLLFAAFLAANGMPTVVSNSRHEQVEAFIATELERTMPASATRYRPLQRLFNWLDERARSPDHRWRRCARRGSRSSRCLYCPMTISGACWPTDRCSPATRPAQQTNAHVMPIAASPPETVSRPTPNRAPVLVTLL